MRDRPSFTAAWVAAARGLGATLPADARIAPDPYGARFGGGFVQWAAARGTGGRPFVLVAETFTLYMQVRTRALDDVLVRFLADGGDQVVLLGAGYDCRAARFADKLQKARVYEVDHPATQARKRALMQDTARAGVEYLAWNFEERPLSALPDALAALGHERARRTLTIWEGVTMYLTESAIDDTVAAVRAFSAPGSPFAFTYFDKRAMIERPSALIRVVGSLVGRLGEPYRFGWDPAALSAWWSARGFAIAWDREVDDLARELLPAHHASRVKSRGRRIALATRT